MSTDSLDQAVAAFLAVRDRLFCIAYRILNDCTEAEDIVQDAWLRWQVCDRKAVVDPMAYLATTTRRLCLNSLQSARARRETCLGPWLAERVDPGADPLLGVERGEELEHATRRLLERLSPT
jgi:DNA-directed RNA polymerase specialized sigma24 family protein